MASNDISQCASCLEPIPDYQDIVILTCLHIICRTCRGDFPIDLKCPECHIPAVPVEDPVPGQIKSMRDRLDNLITAGADQLDIYRRVVDNCRDKLVDFAPIRIILVEHLKARQKNFGLLHDELSDELLALQSISETIDRLAISQLAHVRESFAGNFQAAMKTWKQRIDRFSYVPLRPSNFTIWLEKGTRYGCYVVIIHSTILRFNFNDVLDRIVTYPSGTVIAKSDVFKLTHKYNYKIIEPILYKIRTNDRYDCKIYMFEEHDSPVFILEDMIIDEKN